MSGDPYHWLPQVLQTIHRAGWHRTETPIVGRSGPMIQLDYQPYFNFASNDYLGLAGDDRLIQAAIAATQEYGTGSSGSRLITGHRPLHQQLEQAIAQLKQTEAALVFSSGYLTNLGTIAALVGKRDLILADQYNHSSLKMGAIASQATVIDYLHGDMSGLRSHLEHQRHQFRRCLILTDSVFSMDGDCCPLPTLLDLATEFEAMVLVDEAHATGVMGATGGGWVEHCGCSGRAMVQMGTLSKACGSLGGFVAGSASLIDFLRNRSASWIYTTGLSPADTAAALAAIQIIQQEPQRREKLWQNVAHFKSLLAPKINQSRHSLERSQKGNLPIAKLLPSESPIICLSLPTLEATVSIAKHLRKSGIFAPAIRPPTVPTSRIRLTFMATHTPEQIESLACCLKEHLQISMAKF